MSVSPESIARSPSLRVVRAVIGLFWYGLIVAGIISVIFAVAFTVGDPERGPHRDGFAVGGLHLNTTTTVPIRVAYDWDWDNFALERGVPNAVSQAVRDERQILVDGHDSVRLRLQDGFGAAYQAVMMVFCLVVGMSVVYTLRELFASVADGQAFSELNAIRLRRIGVIVIAGSLFYSAIQWVLASHYVERFEIAHARTWAATSLHAEDLLLGGILLILGQLFQLAARNEAERAALRAEQELTV